MVEKRWRGKITEEMDKIDEAANVINKQLEWLRWIVDDSDDALLRIASSKMTGAVIAIERITHGVRELIGMTK